MKKVTIVITESGYETKIELGDKTYTQRFEATTTGSKCIEGNFEEEEEIPDELYEAVSGFTQYDIMTALQEI